MREQTCFKFLFIPKSLISWSLSFAKRKILHLGFCFLSSLPSIWPEQPAVVQQQWWCFAHIIFLHIQSIFSLPRNNGKLLPQCDQIMGRCTVVKHCFHLLWMWAFCFFSFPSKKLQTPVNNKNIFLCLNTTNLLRCIWSVHKLIHSHPVQWLSWLRVAWEVPACSEFYCIFFFCTLKNGDFKIISPAQLVNYVRIGLWANTGSC